MKRLFIMMVVVAMFIPMAVNAKKRSGGGEAKAVFKEYAYDFGTVPEKGGAVSHDFEFVNEGDGNLVIFDATAECGCTRPTYPKDPIAKGKKNKIKVTYNPIGRPGPFEKTVTLKTNGNPRKIRLKIRGSVK